MTAWVSLISPLSLPRSTLELKRSVRLDGWLMTLLAEVGFHLWLDRYACECFLYRLGRSDLREWFVLKGATPLSV